MINKSDLIVDKFVFQFHKTDTSLIIEADNQATSLEFSCELRNNTIPDITNQIFVDIDDLYIGLLGAIQGSNQDTKVCMSRDGKLTFSHKTMIGSREKIFSFTIALEGKITDTKDKLERQVSRISSRQVEIQEKFEELSGRTKKLEELLIKRVYFEKTMSRRFEELHSTIRRLQQITTERFNDFDKKFQQIQEASLLACGDGSKTGFRFDRYGANREQYDFSNGCKTITKRVYGHAPMFADSILIPIGKQKFVVKIEKHLPKSPFLIGIASSKYRSNHEPCYHVQGTCFFNYNGEVYQIFSNGPFTKLPKAPQQTIEGLLVTVIVDFVNNQVSFKVNGEDVVKVNFNLSNLKEIGVYPCIDMISPNDCISFL